MPHKLPLTASQRSSLPINFLQTINSAYNLPLLWALQFTKEARHRGFGGARSLPGTSIFTKPSASQVFGPSLFGLLSQQTAAKVVGSLTLIGQQIIIYGLLITLDLLGLSAQH